MSRPTTNSARPARYGGAGPRLSAACPATTTPTRLASMKALKTQPYRRRPPSSRANTGTAGATAKASDATNVMVRTSPSVSARCSGAHNDNEGVLLLAGAAAGLLQALLAGRDPRHHGPKLGADLLDLVFLRLTAVFVEVGAAVLVLGDPFIGEAAVLDLVEDAAHLGLGLLVDDARPARVVAVLGRVGDREVHARDAVLVHEVDDQLQLVQALEVGRLGLVTRPNESLEAGLHQLDDAATQHHLLAEEVGLGLLLERGLEHAGAGGADGVGVGQREVHRLA